MKNKFNRREFLQAVSGTVLLAPWLLRSGFAKTTEDSRLILNANIPASAPIKDFLRTRSIKNPQNEILTADSRSLLLNDRRWLPVMGEFHYSRYPENEWREEILKMKAGGVDIVATYVFWIHHEEIEGQFDWSGQRDLHRFVELCKDTEMPLALRVGPWCHGEVRNGGLPDWLLKKGWKIRSDDANYLKKVKNLYGEIFAQVKNLFWKDGGNIIAVQLENEFKGRAEHLLTLKKIALEIGLDAPLYTRTGWTNTSTPLPSGEIIPLYGVYAEGFWDREITPMPGKYKEGFLFQSARIDSSIATDQLGTGNRKEAEDVDAYPYFCCEIGGGMMTSYHRRILIYPKDIESTAVIKIGSGNNMQGYYMYHGGTNPEGRLSTLQESQATNYWNDLPVKSYDFQAPLGEFGQINEHYHLLRRNHLFLRDFGESLANMPAYLPDRQPQTANDISTLRWSARTDGESGYVFVNNYQRLQKSPAKSNVQFQLNLKNENLTFPQKPIAIPSDAVFYLPFNLKVADASLIYATAQPICKLENNNEIYLFFAEVESIRPEFVFNTKTKLISENSNANYKIRNYRTASGKSIKIISFGELQSLAVWKGKLQGQERVFLTKAGLILDGNALHLSSEDQADMRVAIFPAPRSLAFNSKALKPKPAGIFNEFSIVEPKTENFKIHFERIKQADSPREIKMGSKGVAEAPSDVDFDSAAIWRISLPKEIEAKKMLLRIGYNGDAARIYLGDKLLTDNFYNGNVFEIGLNRYAPEIHQKDLLLKILPLRRDAPIYLQDDAKPVFEGHESICKLLTIKLVEIHEASLTVK